MQEWILCPRCGNKTRVRIRDDSELKNFPLYCPKCRQETLIDVKATVVTVHAPPGAGNRTEYGNETILKEPDAKTQSR